ncbi:MAG TPA: hypothetical protein VK602_15045 [Phyllobacterium sp.]|nr:hypothetical protein [Phyllobacterium sp.]
MVKAPFNASERDAINAFQRNERFHPFTCPSDKPECCGQAQPLFAVEAGMVCPCGAFLQDWVHDFMVAL